MTAEGQPLTDEIRMFEDHRNEYIDIIRSLRKQHPNMRMHSLENLAENEVLNRGPKSRAFYRIQATRKLTGGGLLTKHKSDRDRRIDGKGQSSTLSIAIIVTQLSISYTQYKLAVCFGYIHIDTLSVLQANFSLWSLVCK